MGAFAGGSGGGGDGNGESVARERGRRRGLGREYDCGNDDSDGLVVFVGLLLKILCCLNDITSSLS